MKFKIIVKIAASLGFLCWALQAVDTQKLVAAASQTDPALYCLALVTVFANTVVLAMKYRIAMKPSGIDQPLSELVKINLVCRFYSSFLTTAVGQGVVRWYTTTQSQPGRLKFLAVMAIERASFLFALASVVLLSGFFLQTAQSHLLADKLRVFAYACLLGTTLLFCFAAAPFSHRIDKRLASGTERHHGSKTIKTVLSLFKTLTIYRKNGRILVFVALLAFAWHGLYLFRVYMLAACIDVPAGFFQISWISSVVLLLQILPISLNGLGIREGAYAFLFALEGLPAEKGVLIGLLFFSQMLIISCVGGGVALRYNRRRGD